MPNQGPIVLIDDDQEDQEIIKSLLEAMTPNSPILLFTNGQSAIDFLRTADHPPFLIISEVSMQPMNGLELRRQIEQDKTLRKRAIPFIFFTHPVHQHLVEEAYDLTIQGFFKKKTRIDDIKNQLQAIVEYWSNCFHPNRFEDEP